MKAVILVGGGGTKLFPLARRSYPEQFLQIDSQYSLLAQTVQRFLKIVSPEDILIVTNPDYKYHVEAELSFCKAEKAHILLESAGKSTASMIALAMRFAAEKMSITDQETIFVSPSDQVIRSDKEFVASVIKADKIAQAGKLVIWGIQPTQPETGYVYIQAGDPYKDGFVAKSFKAKPDMDTAKKYLASGNYFWHSGMLAFSLDCMLEELRTYQPKLYELASLPWDDMLNSFLQMSDLSIECAVIEQSQKAVILPFTAYWNDIRSWDAIYEVLNKDESGNIIQGDCMSLSCKNTLMMSRNRLIAGIGLEDLLVVETDDVILVAKQGEAHQVKELVDKLKAQNRKEATEHTTMYRPWGSYTVMGDGPGYKMKKITVMPGQKLSLQMHYHRSEHWIVIGGTAKVTVGEVETILHKNASTYIPSSVKHRLENPGRIPLEIIEIQNGDYLEEDDIVRFEDTYGRV